MGKMKALTSIVAPDDVPSGRQTTVEVLGVINELLKTRLS